MLPDSRPGPRNRVRPALFPSLAALLALIALAAGAPAAQGYQQAPMLDASVEDGTLPPVEQRLPPSPPVVEPVDRIGDYGGEWRRLAITVGDLQLHARLGYESLVVWDESGTKVVPGVAHAWEVRDEGRTYVFHLHRGIRWSDGAPFTARDIMFTFEDMFANEELFPTYPSFFTLDDIRLEVSAPDDYTIVFRSPRPYGIFLEMLAFRGINLFNPKHYLRQFHPAYTDAETLASLTEAENLDHWRQLFLRKASLSENPECPTIRPWRLRVGPPAMRWTCERNPYYWKVDPAGNQLPYIDRLSFAVVQNAEILNFKAMAGEVDFQTRGIDPANFALFMENRERGGYRVLRDANSQPTVIYVNPACDDPAVRYLYANPKFRAALSLALNREEIIAFMFTGLAVPSRGVASPFDPYYLEAFEDPYIEYDPERANALLDELGLERGRDGIRRLPNGEPFRRIMNVYGGQISGPPELWQLVASYWREVGLDIAVKLDSTNLSVMRVRGGETELWAYAAAGMHWVIDPIWYVPWNAASYFAPEYGLYRSSEGKAGKKPPPEYQQLVDWYLEMRAELDPERKLALGRKILKQWSEQVYTIGILRSALVTIVSERFHNVPDEIIHDYRVMTPGYIRNEQFFISGEE
jgi:peptide/nickel transport system substrate-binding protein